MYTIFVLERYKNGLNISKTIYVLSYSKVFTFSIRLEIQKFIWIPLFLVIIPQLHKLGVCGVVHHVDRYCTSIRHTLWVHLSNLLLLLHQLMEFNETCRDIFFNHTMWRCTSYFYFSNGFLEFLIIWNILWLEAGNIDWLAVSQVLHWF